MIDLTYDPEILDPRVRRAIARGHDDILRVREQPMHSNRSPIIDSYNRRFGSPLGSYWCGNALGTWWRDGGLETPAVPGAVRNWVPWARSTGRWSDRPVPGAAIIYGPDPAHPNHCGIVYDVQDAVTVFTIEGNTSLDGYSRDGELVTGKLARLAHLIGYVHPFAATTPLLED